MAIGGDYPVPITVNGFLCRNCADVSKAQKNVDPADPDGVKARAKEALGVNDLKKPQNIFNAQKIDEAVAARQAAGERGTNANIAARGYESGGYSPPPPGSLVNLSA